MREVAYISLIYFGAYLVPIVYFAITRWKGKGRKAMLWGVAIHTFWNLAVWGFVYYSWAAGYSEYYWGWALLIPVNLVSLVYYLGALSVSLAPAKTKAL